MQNRSQANTAFIEIRKPNSTSTSKGLTPPPNSPNNSPKKRSQIHFFKNQDTSKDNSQADMQIKSNSSTPTETNRPG